MGAHSESGCLVPQTVASPANGVSVSCQVSATVTGEMFLLYSLQTTLRFLFRTKMKDLNGHNVTKVCR